MSPRKPQPLRSVLELAVRSMTSIASLSNSLTFMQTDAAMDAPLAEPSKEQTAVLDVECATEVHEQSSTDLAEAERQISKDVQLATTELLDAEATLRGADEAESAAAENAEQLHQVEPGPIEC